VRGVRADDGDGEESGHLLVDLQRLVGRDQHVDAQVELPSPHQKGVLDVPGYHVRLCEQWK
jgi:hypothetical protein